MSDAASGGKKMTTAEILAAARAQAANASGAASSPATTPEAKPEEAPAAPSAPAASSAPPPKPTAPAAAPEKKPTSTAEILAAVRAQATKASGGEAPTATAPGQPAATAPAAPAGKPKSTADILAAARAAAAAKASGAAPTAAAPAAPAGDKPKSTADILAAARASKAGAASGEAQAKAKPTPKAAAAPSDGTGEKVPVAEMLAKLRASVPSPEGTAAPSAKVAEPKPAVPLPMPVKPEQVAKKIEKPVDHKRRSLLMKIILSPLVLVATPFAAAWTSFTATTLAATLGTLRFMFPNIITEPPRKFKVGPPTDFDLGTVATKFVASSGIWIVHTDQYKAKNVIYALYSVCTHLGCTPSWLEGEQKFKCPCHGSGFYITGINFEGPAPRPLERAGIRLAPDGMIEVDKSVKFQEEMGQWDDPASYLEVS